MTGRIHTYYFCRLNLVGHIPDKYQMLYDSIRSDAITDVGKFRYGFFDAMDIEIDGDRFAFGVLVKFKPLLEGEIVDEVTHQVLEGGLPHGVVTKSKYFLHYRSGIIAYHPIKSRLSDMQFREVFADLIGKANNDFFVSAVLKSINEEYKILEAIAKFQIIKKISFNIVPTNPSNREPYQDLDDKLKFLRVQKLSQQMVADEGGFNKDALIHDDALKAVSMATDGYGTASVSGEVDGRNITISTNESPVAAEIIDSDSPKTLLNNLYSQFRQIWNRMNK